MRTQDFVRKKLTFLLLLSILYGVGWAQQNRTLLELSDFGSNPGNLKMLVYNKESTTQKPPLVVVLHGCTQCADDVAALSGWNKLAERYHFMVLYPQQKRINNTTLCFNWFRNQDIEKGKGECESIYQMIRYTINHYHVDTSRIFITGVSAGAAMSVVMMATHPELFQWGAIFEGGAYKKTSVAVKDIFRKKESTQNYWAGLVREQNPEYRAAYPRMIIYQGTDDAVVPYKNLNTLLLQWTGLHSLGMKTGKKTDAYRGISDIRQIEYTDSLGNTRIIVFEVDHLGHRLLVKPGNKDDEGGKIGTYGIDKGYHSTFETAKQFGLLNE